MKKNISTLILLTSLSLLFAGCEKSYVTFEYVLTCSPDLLKYATPQVTYKNSEGQNQTFLITEADMTDVESNVTVTINGQTQPPKQLKEWRKGVKYENFGIVEDVMTVTYIPKSDVHEDATIAGLDLSHSLGTSTIEMKDDDGNMHYWNIHSSTIEIGNRTSNNLIETIKSFNEYKGFRFEASGKMEEKKLKE